MKNEAELEKFIKVSKKVVGLRQVLRSIAADELRCVVLSEDADEALKIKITQALNGSEAGVELAPSMAWLGRASDIAVGAAVVGIFKE